MKTYVIGDIHGCFEAFDRLLNKINGDWTADRLILLGDYIDRGEKSWEVIEAVMILQHKYGKDQIIALRGNHEQMAIDTADNQSSNWFYNGGRATLDSFASHGKTLDDALVFFRGLPLYYEDAHHIFVHAGIRPGITMGEQSADDLLWIREEFFRSTCTFGKTVVFGHTPTVNINGSYEPIQMKKRIAMDTACVYDGALSAIEIERGHITKTYQTNRKTRRNHCA